MGGGGGGGGKRERKHATFFSLPYLSLFFSMNLVGRKVAKRAEVIAATAGRTRQDKDKIREDKAKAKDKTRKKRKGRISWGGAPLH
jgi:hypothetical protein